MSNHPVHQPPSDQNDHLRLGAILFDGMDQADFTGPFEVLANVPHSTFHVLGRDQAPVRDARGLMLIPQMALAEAPQLDLLLVPGGAGVNVLMEDETVLTFVRRQAAGAKFIFSVCTGALILGAAGLLKGRRATTHWASHHLLPVLGARPVNDRVVVDGNIVTAAGVTSGIDGALRVTALLRGEPAAQMIQLYTQYAPEPPFNSGTPESAPPELVRTVQSHLREVLEARQAIVKRVAAKLGL
jgi:cyclohexyl-isocyanide hydratase